ncbi:hypothetical protein VTJ04DRAFT_5597 [Mycothermus thermophilus]|uniref:uncharacterized protein n=1 Tax=Humicola insolens TaxID=85995 RepID=UPI0037449E30
MALAHTSNCAHEFVMIKTDNTLIQWTCHICLTWMRSRQMGVVEDGSLRLRQTGYAGLVAGSVPGGSFPPHPRAALQSNSKPPDQTVIGKWHGQTKRRL